MFVKNFSHVSSAHISKSKMCFNVKSSTYYFHIMMKILTDFQICINVPLSKDFHSFIHSFIKVYTRVLAQSIIFT